MPQLILKPTKTTPLVWIDASTATGVVAGSSLPENAADFYGKLVAWLDEKLPTMTAPMCWVFRLTYFNTSSTKGLYQVLQRVKAHVDNGHADTVLWDVEDDDEFMREAGENFAEMLALPITFRELSEEAALLENQKLNVALANKAA